MLNLLKEKTNTRIIVGMNGRVWIDGENAGIAGAAILKIARESHRTGLTDRISAFLDAELEKVSK